MIDKATVEVTEGDVNRAYNSNFSPLQIAASRVLNIDIQRIEVKRDKLYVWMYDDSDYVLYTYDEDSYVKIYDFINEWQLVTDGYTDEDGAVPFEGDLISFNIEVDNDTGTHSNHWHGASVDSSWNADESNLHKKNLKFRLTDDEY
tara:strand:- start:67 stop:504 length:438 start_codon:yes stop_codon:yes gene_type:complete